MLKNIGKLFGSQLYLATMYKALLITTYYGMFRIGEVTYSQHTVTASDVHIAMNKKKLLFILRSSKTHCKGNNPQVIKIISNETTRTNGKVKYHLCPFILLRQYLNLRRSKSIQQQFFIFNDRSPVKPSHFRTVRVRNPVLDDVTRVTVWGSVT